MLSWDELREVFDVTLIVVTHELGFAYRKIDWEWLSGGKLPTTFDFSAPQA